MDEQPEMQVRAEGWRKRGHAESMHARAGEFMPQATGKGIELCNLKLPMKRQCSETKCWGSLGGCDEEGCGSSTGCWISLDRHHGGCACHMVLVRLNTYCAIFLVP